jgi:hypothetical protein
MTGIASLARRRAVLAAAPAALALVLSACGGGDGNSSGGGGNVSVAPTPTPTPTPTTTPTPTPTPAGSRNVGPCLSQVIPGTGGATPASLVIPDTLKLDLSKPAGFPNGRRLEDPVVDILLAALFLDVNAPGQSAATFASLPLNPPTNDRPFLSAFPFMAAPQGTPFIAPNTGTSFTFRTDALTNFVRVDREGQPAVATAVIGAALKNAYNDANPAEDVAGTFVQEIVAQLTLLHNGLADDLTALGLKVCSTG